MELKLSAMFYHSVCVCVGGVSGNAYSNGIPRTPFPTKTKRAPFQLMPLFIKSHAEAPHDLYIKLMSIKGRLTVVGLFGLGCTIFHVNCNFSFEPILKKQLKAAI